MLSPSFPIGIWMIVAIWVWLNSPTNILESHPVLFAMTFGMVSSKLSNKLVVSSTFDFDYWLIFLSQAIYYRSLIRGFCYSHLFASFQISFAFIWDLQPHSFLITLLISLFASCYWTVLPLVHWYILLSHFVSKSIFIDYCPLMPTALYLRCRYR